MATNGPISKADGNCVDTKSNMSCDNDVVVLGASIIDYMSYVPQLPGPGETLRATRFQKGFGGKGANQSVSAARLGSKTALISKLGSDNAADKYTENLNTHGVSTAHVTRAEGQSTGKAYITVGGNAENQIIIHPAANDLLSLEDVENAEELLNSTKVLVCQLETSIPATLAALRKFKKGISVLNVSPVPESRSIELFTLPSILCVNQSEAAKLTGRAVPTLAEAKRAISNIIHLGCRTVIITLGADGALFATDSDPKTIHVRAPRIEEVVDTTGAGDAFIGALAHFIARYPEASMLQKVGGAVHIASMTVQQYGTQTSYPLAKDVRLDITQKTFDWRYI